MHHHRLTIRTLAGLGMLVVFATLSSCKSASTTTNTTASQSTAYSEDLSVWRPKAPAPETSENTTVSAQNKKPAYTEPALAVNKPLELVLDSISQIHLNRKFVEGFSIQVFAGKKDEALNVKRQIAFSLPELPCDVQFAEPVFRVKVGKYYTRLDAQEDYAAVKKYFPAAIIVPEKIVLN